MSQPPPPPNQPPGEAPGQRRDMPPPGSPTPGSPTPPASAQPTMPAGIPAPSGPPAPPPGTPSAAAPTPPSAPPVAPGGQPGQPGYGYPQQPPAAPGYGYPQQPSPQQPYAQQPPAHGGFGAPGPYGPASPPGPYGPAGWAPPGAPVPGNPAGGNGARLALIIAVVVALVLAGGGTVWLLSDSAEDTTSSDKGDTGGNGNGGADSGGSGGGGEPETISASLAWEVPAPEVSEEDIIVAAEGAWFTRDTLVRLMDDAIVSYDLATGKERWSVPLERGGGDCQASPTASENRIAVLRGRDCEELTVLDIATGQELTTFPLTGEFTPGEYDYPAILGDTIAVSWGIGGSGYSLDGEQLWRTSDSEPCPETSYAVMDGMFVSQTECGFVGDEGGSIRATDESGTELWEWEYEPTYEGEELQVNSVISADPLVVSARLGDDIVDAEAHIFVIDEKHRTIKHDLDFDLDRYPDPCQVNTLAQCSAAVAHDGRLYLPNLAKGGGDNEISVYDLTTGQAIYEVGPITSTGGALRPFGVSDDKILVYQAGTFDVEGMVMTLDPETEELSPLMALDHETREREATMMSSAFLQENVPLWHENTLVLLSRKFYTDDPDAVATMVFR